MTDKPDLTRVWAAGAPSGNVVDPDTTTPGKFSNGWQAEVPPFEHFNFIQKLQTQGLAHINEQGIAVWDDVTTYPVGGLVKGSDGNVYKAIVSQSNNDPVSDDGTNWLDWEVSNRVIRATSIAAMEAYSAPVGYVFSLNAGGRSGTFDVVAGDFSTELAADVRNGLFVGLSDDTTATTKVAKRRFEGDVWVAWFGEAADGTTNDRDAAFNAMDVQALIGGGEIQFTPFKTYAIGRTFIAGRRGYLSVPANVGINFNGATLQRLGTEIEDPFIETFSDGGISTNHTFRNGTIRGTGAENGVSDQGAGILLFDCDNVFLENITTENTNGDGILARRAARVSGSNIRIGTFGRNGISPTSGEFTWSDLKIDGPPIAGANPGIGYDAENEGTERGMHHIDGGYCKQLVTFVDFYSSGGGTYNHEVYLDNFVIGPAYKPLRFLADNEATTNNIHIGPGVEIIASGTSAQCLGIKNVSGIRLASPVLTKGTTTSDTKAIAISGVVKGLHSIGTKIDPAFGQGIQCVSGGSLSDSFISGSDLQIIILSNGSSDNTFTNGYVDNVTIDDATSTGNVFDISLRQTGQFTYNNGALETDQIIRTVFDDARISRTFDSNGAELQFEGRELFSDHSLGKIKFFSKDNEGNGAQIESRGASVSSGDLRFATSYGTAPTNRFTITQGGNLLPAADNTYEFGSNSARIKEIFAVLQEFADDAAADTGGLDAGQLYKTAGGEVRIKL